MNPNAGLRPGTRSFYHSGGAVTGKNGNFVSPAKNKKPAEVFRGLRGVLEFVYCLTRKNCAAPLGVVVYVPLEAPWTGVQTALGVNAGVDSKVP